ncbi:hypothetical protein AS593_22735 [Caulobacter vibrioides]|uniref:UrcA family protein n=1 Tax=Caulobacter endophyticus TaxID=2172652 RepID=A0A2T9K7X1_9CAUL|nr:hypothetical protein [Caulobacter endophyticus]KSB88397.1 hypothetical protein AS593_22735 [Caulobacter vibrioides]PVM91901.1 hypothetical protein DDF67_06615 [Caulobacter endophyticus]
MTKLPLIAAAAALMALAQPAAAETLLGGSPHAPAGASQRVSVTGKSSSVVSDELTRAARQVCSAALKSSRHPNYASCVTETLGKARADYAALRSAAANAAE